ncbi:hypothetical protein ABK040_008657 [Willaertia magna]
MGQTQQHFKTSDTDPLQVDFLPQEYLPSNNNKNSKLGLMMCPGRNKKNWKRNLILDLNRIQQLYQPNIIVTLITNKEMEKMKIENYLNILKQSSLFNNNNSINNSINNEINSSINGNTINSNEIIETNEMTIIEENKKINTLQNNTLQNEENIIIGLNVNSIHFPITDKSLPKNKEDFCKLIDLIILELFKQKTIIVHCNGGKGRAATVCTAVLIGLKIIYSKIIITNKESNNKNLERVIENVSNAIEIVRKTRGGGTLQNPLQIIWLKTIFFNYYLNRENELNQLMKLILNEESDNTVNNLNDTMIEDTTINDEITK